MCQLCPASSFGSLIFLAFAGGVNSGVANLLITEGPPPSSGVSSPRIYPDRTTHGRSDTGQTRDPLSDSRILRPKKTKIAGDPSLQRSCRAGCRAYASLTVRAPDRSHILGPRTSAEKEKRAIQPISNKAFTLSLTVTAQPLLKQQALLFSR